MKTALIAAWWLFCLMLADVAIGVVYGRRLALHQDEKNLTYRYDSELGWFPIPNSTKTFVGSRQIHIQHNSRGFRDIEHVLDSKPRIVFLGDSYVWGYDVEQDERFTDTLRPALPGWSIYNLGVSGYGTDQEYLLLQREYDYYRPQIVFLLFCKDNDDDDDSRNGRKGLYYKPYYTVDGGQLTLRGVPVPRSEGYFFARHDVLARSNWLKLIVRAHDVLTAQPEYVASESPARPLLKAIRDFVTARGARFVVGLQDSYPELERFLADAQIPYVDLDNSYRYPAQSRHWTPEGHIVVRDRILRFLERGSYLAVVQR